MSRPADAAAAPTARSQPDLRWIWLVYPASYGTALLLQAAYFHGVWKRRPIRSPV